MVLFLCLRYCNTYVLLFIIYWSMYCSKYRPYRAMEYKPAFHKLEWVVSRLVACVMPYHTRPPVSRDTALHKQLKVIQPSGSTHCSSIPYILNFMHICVSCFHQIIIPVSSKFMNILDKVLSLFTPVRERWKLLIERKDPNLTTQSQHYIDPIFHGP